MLVHNWKFRRRSNAVLAPEFPTAGGGIVTAERWQHDLKLLAYSGEIVVTFSIVFQSKEGKWEGGS
jgi:hypothetical protein